MDVDDGRGRRHGAETLKTLGTATCSSFYASRRDGDDKMEVRSEAARTMREGM